jgi:alkanesulfonate monooxygenase SsuD/methylene tetrahydromethanopterin reductase-like flavin-dependent oxidoreductase (luciferase family)
VTATETATRPLCDDPETIKVIHHYGVGLHTELESPDVHDPRWQQRQVEEFVEFAAEAEELGYDGISLTEHHLPSMTCPSPHLLLAAAAAVTSRIRMATAVTTLPLYNPVRVAEEAGTLDLLSNGRFELGLGRGLLPEAELTIGRPLDDESFAALWLEGLALFQTALTTLDFTFEGRFWNVPYPFSISTRPLQEPLPIWVGSRSLTSVEHAAQRGWSLMRNFGSHEDHRQALEHYVRVGAEHGHSLSGANMMVEKFVAIGETTSEAEQNYARVVTAFKRFFGAFNRGQRHEAVDPERVVPIISIVGTPDRVAEALSRTIEETGSMRILVELFSMEQTRLFAKEVLPALQQRTRSAAAV